MEPVERVTAAGRGGRADQRGRYGIDGGYAGALTPRTPWFGYELGYWPDNWAKATRLTSAGRYLGSGKDFRALRTEASYYETGVVKPPEEDRP